MCNSHMFMCLCSSPDGSLLSKLVCPSLRHFQENRGRHLKLRTFLRVRHLPKQHVFFIQMPHGVTTMLNLSFFLSLFVQDLQRRVCLETGAVTGEAFPALHSAGDALSGNILHTWDRHKDSATIITAGRHSIHCFGRCIHRYHALTVVLHEC